MCRSAQSLDLLASHSVGLVEIVCRVNLGTTPSRCVQVTRVRPCIVHGFRILAIFRIEFQRFVVMCNCQILLINNCADPDEIGSQPIEIKLAVGVSSLESATSLKSYVYT